MNAVGIDVSKGKSMVTVMRPFGEIVACPFEVGHTTDDLKKLVAFIKKLDGETRIVMEYTGAYFQPIARHLHNAGLFVSVVNAILVHKYGGNSIRHVKTDKKDAIKIANYALDHWVDLEPFILEEDKRQLLKTYNRQYNQYMKLYVMLKNNLISLLDQAYPGVNRLFSSEPRPGDGHEKWLDFVAKFWHCECVSGLSRNAFTAHYSKWCKKAGYRFSSSKAETIYDTAYNHIGVLPKSESTKQLVKQAVVQINSIAETLAVIRREMTKLASQLPEYPVVMAMHGAGEILGPQLMAEIGDVRRFHGKQALIAYAGIDAPPYQSGTYEARSRNIAKRGSPALRRSLFQVMSCILRLASPEDPVFQFLDRKRSEGKNFYVYMIAGENKFLRIYYARVKEYLDKLETA